MNDAYKERCRCIRDIKPRIPAAIWTEADSQNKTGDNWRTVLIAIEILTNFYEN